MNLWQHEGGMWLAEDKKRGLVVAELTQALAKRKLNFLIRGHDKWEKLTEKQQGKWLKKLKKRDGETWQK